MLTPPHHEYGVTYDQFRLAVLVVSFTAKIEGAL